MLSEIAMGATAEVGKAPPYRKVVSTFTIYPPILGAGSKYTKVS
jgi:hypothetical protein